jgi:Tfp pilus assembly protein FimT
MNIPRRGKSLIEMVIIIGIMSIVLSMAATTLVALFRVERQIRSSESHRQTLDRLSGRLRADAHSAVAVKTDDGCQFSLPSGQTIEYAVALPEITREVRRDAEVLHRDAFRLAPRSQAAFAVEGESAGQLVRLSIMPGELPSRAHLAATRPVTIAAAVNLHRVAARAEAAP